MFKKINVKVVVLRSLVAFSVMINVLSFIGFYLLYLKSEERIKKEVEYNFFESENIRISETEKAIFMTRNC